MRNESLTALTALFLYSGLLAMAIISLAGGVLVYILFTVRRGIRQIELISSTRFNQYPSSRKVGLTDDEIRSFKDILRRFEESENSKKEDKR